MKGCEKQEEILARYLHGEVLVQERDSLEAHLSVCPDCERLYREIRFIDTTLRGLPDRLVEPPPWLRERIRARIEEEAVSRPRWALPRWAVGVGLAAACILAVAVTVFDRKKEAQPVAKSPVSRPAATALAEPPVAGRTGGEGRTDGGSSVTAKKSVPARPARPAVRSGKEDRAVASAPKVEVVKEVRIYFFCPPAARVAVTGDFNDWDAKGVPLSRGQRPGLWEVTLRLHPGAYSYNFIVDGTLLVPDPESPNQMPDGYGGTNSILLVKGGNSV